MEQKSFLDDLAERRRARLRAAGWKQVGGVIHRRFVWCDPETGALLQEDEAFKRLAPEADKKETEGA